MDKDKQSFAIYVDRRPFRIAYFLDEKSTNEGEIDKIVDYSVRKWGGRYNYILPISKQKLTNEQWKFLDIYDPDIIKSFTPLSSNLIKQINRKISSYHVIDGSTERHISPRTSDEGISILPTPRNIALAGNSSVDRTHLVLFDINECNDDLIKNFVKRNFGILELRELQNKVIEEQENKLILKVVDKSSLISALSQLNDFKTFVFPSQLCSLGDSLDNINGYRNDEEFHVFIGNSTKDLIAWWNNPACLADWTRNKFRQIWLPEEFCKDEDLLPTLKDFITRRSDPYGTGAKPVRFISYSLQQSILEDYKEKLVDKMRVRAAVELRKTLILPDLQDYFSFDRNKHTMVYFRGTGQKEKIIIPPPEIEERVMGGEHWMNDLYIESDKKRVVPVNFETWWQLPKDNNLASLILNVPSRITRSGLLSCISSRASSFHPSSQEVEITLPSPLSIFRTLFAKFRGPYYTDDVRYDQNKRMLYQIKISNTGGYLQGFLEAFSGLDTAHNILKERHWRLFFEKLSNVQNKDEARRLSGIKQTLKKKITSATSITSFTSGKPLEWLSQLVIKSSKEYADFSKSGGVEELFDIARQEIKEYNKRNPKNKFRFKKKNVIEDFSYLTDLGVVLIGLDIKCPICGFKEWRELGELTQEVVCRGCQSRFMLTPEKVWKYKLNSLVEKGIKSYGLTPVTLVLGQLFGEARNFFMFAPCLDLYKGKKPITDLDVVCILDGKFVIGEVKQSQDSFGPDDFDTICKVAKELNPDRIIFSSLDEKPSKNRLDHIKRINKELEDFGIQAEWLYLDKWIFEASPIY